MGILILGELLCEVKFRGGDNNAQVFATGDVSVLSLQHVLAATGCPKDPEAGGFAQIRCVLSKIKSRTEIWDFSAYSITVPFATGVCPAPLRPTDLLLP